MSEKAEAPAIDLAGIYEKLSAPLPAKAEQHTKGQDTGKGYDTSGYGVAWVEERLNEVLTVQGWETSSEVLWHKEGTYPKSGALKHEFTVKMSMRIKINGLWGPWRSAVGGHDSRIHGDGLAGAESRAIKKVAAKFGVGNDAYKGLVDPDNKPLDETETKSSPPVTKTADEPPQPTESAPPTVDKTEGEQDVQDLLFELYRWSEVHIPTDRDASRELVIAMGRYTDGKGIERAPNLDRVSLKWLQRMWIAAQKIDDTTDALEIARVRSYALWKEQNQEDLPI